MWWSTKALQARWVKSSPLLFPLIWVNTMCASLHLFLPLSSLSCIHPCSENIYITCKCKSKVSLQTLNVISFVFTSRIWFIGWYRQSLFPLSIKDNFYHMWYTTEVMIPFNTGTFMVYIDDGNWKNNIKGSCVYFGDKDGLNRGVVVEWIRRRTVHHKFCGSSPVAALMSFGKTLIYICHTPPRWSKWVPGRNLFLETQRA